jgi:hypothetical protein
MSEKSPGSPERPPFRKGRRVKVRESAEAYALKAIAPEFVINEMYRIFAVISGQGTEGDDLVYVGPGDALDDEIVRFTPTTQPRPANVHAVSSRHFRGADH